MFTEEHDMLRQSVREFVENEVTPYVDEWEEKEEYSMDAFRKMGELGLLGLRVPEEYGGGGTDYWSAVSYTHLRAHETRHELVCRLLLEKKKKKKEQKKQT